MKACSETRQLAMLVAALASLTPSMIVLVTGAGCGRRHGAPTCPDAGTGQTYEYVIKRGVALEERDGVFEGQSQTTIRVAGQEIVITLEDAHDMKRALLEYLRKSEVQWSDYLVLMTEKVSPWIGPDGSVRIGLWFLRVHRGTSLVLTYRTMWSPPAEVQLDAYVERTKEGWKVSTIRLRSKNYSPKRSSDWE